MTNSSEPVLPNRPSQIKARHLKRDALIYIRQSSPRQVRDHAGSTAVQRALVEKAREYGWPESAIKIVDDDLGLSGTRSDQRMGFQEMLRRIDRDEVGIVLFHDVSRLSRNPHDAEAFLIRAIRRGVVIYVDGHLFDTGDRDLAELFGFRVKSLLAWWENAAKAQSFRLHKEAKASNGHAVSQPPIGYVVSVKGQWGLDPNSDVRDAVRRVFDLYLKLGSIRKVAQYFESHHLRFPRYVRGELRWRPVSLSHIKIVLSNPRYTPDYYFGLTKVVEATEDTKRRIVPQSPDDACVSRDHHEPYVSRETWEQIRTMLSARAPRNLKSPRNGSAFLQSIAWCGKCNRQLYAKYQDRVRDAHLPTYLCEKKDRLGIIHFCFSVHGSVLNAAVVDRVLGSVTPATIEDAMAATDAFIGEQEKLRKAHLRLIQRAEDEVAEAEHRSRLVDPENRGVQKMLEARWEEKIKIRDELQRALDEQLAHRPVALTPDDAPELVRLSQDVQRLWSASTTTNVDRKRLLQTLISRVVLTPRDEWVDVDIVWQGGAHEAFRLLTSKGLTAYIAAARTEGGSDAAIEARLSREGVTNRWGRPVSRPAIYLRLRLRGMNYKEMRRRALQLVRELALAGRTRLEILADLREHGPQHPRGQWTRALVDCALKSLCSGKIDGVEPLPPDFRVAVRLQTNDQVIERTIRSLKAGQSWGAITDALNAEGLRPLKAARFSERQLRALFRYPRTESTLAHSRWTARKATAAKTQRSLNGHHQPDIKSTKRSQPVGRRKRSDDRSEGTKQ